jgi:hypothetical protein
VVAARRGAGPLELGRLLVGEHLGPGKEAHTLRRLHREAAAAPRYKIDDDLGVLPVLELGRADVDRAALDGAEIDVLTADAELASRVAHRRAAVAAATGLVEQQVAMGVPQCRDYSRRRFGDQDTFDHRTPEMEGRRVPGDERTPAAVGQKNPMAFGL